MDKNMTLAHHFNHLIKEHRYYKSINSVNEGSVTPLLADGVNTATVTDTLFKNTDSIFQFWTFLDPRAYSNLLLFSYIRLINRIACSQVVFPKGDNFIYTINKHMGTIESIIKNGIEQLAAPVALGACRAPLDNDRRFKKDWYRGHPNAEVLAENIDKQFSKIYSCTLSGNKVTICGALSGVARLPYMKYALTYEFYEEGEIDVSFSGNVRDNFAHYLPRFGFEFTLKNPNCKFSYYGMGPEECYCDMKEHAKYGIYESDAQSQYVHYVKPQEHGNHYGARYIDVYNGLIFSSDKEFEFNISQYDIPSLTYSSHTNELNKNGFTNLRIDYKMSGVGSHSCGPALSKKYQLCEKIIDFKFSIC